MPNAKSTEFVVTYGKQLSKAMKCYETKLKEQAIIIIIIIAIDHRYNNCRWWNAYIELLIKETETILNEAKWLQFQRLNDIKMEKNINR